MGGCSVIQLRDYQQAATDAVFAYFERASGNPIVVLPCGAGKSLCIAAFCKEAIGRYSDTRVLVATHRAELIEQDARAIQNYWPECDVGVYSAGLGRRQIRQVTVAGVQSIVNVAGLPAFDLIVVDECHLIPKEGDGQYRTLIERVREANPDVKVIGYTATPFRLSGGRLTRGENKIFNSICYELPIQHLVDAGHLVPLVSPQKGGAGYSTAGVGTHAGDFKIGELSASVEAQCEVTRAALEEAAVLASNRKSWLVFCVSVEHARQAAQCLFALGISAAVVTGDDDMGARRSKIEAFKRGDLRALVSVEVLSIGFDAPCADCIVGLRPTQSTGWYIQQAGRAMRLHPGKTDALYLDYAGCVERHGPITAVKPKESRETLSPKIKICPSCDGEVKVWARECGECGFVFPMVPREIAHDKTASNRAIMGPPPEPEWIDTPAGTSLEKWEKKPTEDNPNPPPTVVVKYYTGNMAKKDYREWICPEHGGFARTKFEKWWREHGGMGPPPATVAETLERQTELRYVAAIVVEKDGKFDRVARVRLAAPRDPGADDDRVDSDMTIDDVLVNSIHRAVDHDDDPWGEPVAPFTSPEPTPFDDDEIPF